MDIEHPTNNPNQQPQVQPQPQTQPLEIQYPKHSFILPGQPLPQSLPISSYTNTTFLASSETLIPLYSGFPTQTKNDVTTMITFPIQYLPNKNDLVIGVVKIKTADNFILDIGAPLDGVLGGLQFDGVTKRNKPNLKPGTPVFCRVTEYSKYTGARLSCMNKTANKKNNELGQLKDGYIFWIPQYKHQVIQQNLLQRIGKCIKFQVAFGKNGRIWINTSKMQNIMVIYNMFKLMVENVSEQKINAMITMLK